MSLALIPGSFDPMTLGHLSLVKEALKRYDKAVVAVMNNDKKTYLFDLPTRRRLAELTVAGLPRVRVVASEGLLVDLFDELHADIIVKGVRNETDRRYEEEMAAYNLSCNPRAKTLLLPAAKDVEKLARSSGISGILSVHKTVCKGSEKRVSPLHICLTAASRSI